MAQLNGNSIWNLCHDGVSDSLKERDRLHDPKTGRSLPMITPFLETKLVINGKSAGLSVASYDLRIAHDLTLGPHPGYFVRTGLGVPLSLIIDTPPPFALAHTIENVAIPLNVSGYVCDKSTYARMGVSCFNTLFDPGFIGNCTLELVNLSSETIIIRAGDPICQMVFHKLDQAADRGYEGKYQYQPSRPMPAMLEGTGLD